MGLAVSHRPAFPIHNDADRLRAAQAVFASPPGWVWIGRPENRSDRQNAYFHVLLDELAANVRYDGGFISDDEWKEILIVAHWGYDLKPHPFEEGRTVAIRRSSAQLSTQEFNDLIEIALMVGARAGYVFTDPRPGDERHGAKPRKQKPAGKARSRKHGASKQEAQRAAGPEVPRDVR